MSVTMSATAETHKVVTSWSRPTVCTANAE
jgi:hypothetical protein